MARKQKFVAHEGKLKSGYTTIKIPEPYHRSIRIVKGRLFMRGIGDLPDWLQETLTKGKRGGIRDSDIIDAGIIILRLLMRGKSLDEIKRMSKQDVQGALSQSLGDKPTEVVGRNLRRTRKRN